MKIEIRGLVICKVEDSQFLTERWSGLCGIESNMKAVDANGKSIGRAGFLHIRNGFIVCNATIEVEGWPFRIDFHREIAVPVDDNEECTVKIGGPSWHGYAGSGNKDADREEVWLAFQGEVR